MLFAVNGCNLSIKVSIKSRTSGELGPEAGSVMAFDVNQENIHIFHADTGQRIPQ